ncbi:MAG: HU family DNA-binding protein [Candidatus Caenarcaniphilales bacterium]|nr:HU family DNA-binding protein [Candidatus Caenarcaniphilales bacterium]
MNKSELIDAIAELSDLTKKDSEKSLNATLDAIYKSLSKGEEVSIANFGSFKVKKRKARKGRNPRTGEEMEIPEKNVVSFSAGKNLRENV